MIIAKFTIDGPVSKTDIIGTFYTMIEGYYKDFNFKDLQSRGKIGRIKIELNQSGSISIGTIYVPTDLDILETSLLAATIETIPKVGVYNAKFEVVKIEDRRRLNKEYIYKRAREIAKNIVEESLSAEELIKNLKKDLLSSMIRYYGIDRLPGGPNIHTSDSIIVVEGKADVNNLVEKGYLNVIAINGKYDAPILEKLISEKETILFVDSDKGGEFIIKEMLSRYNIEYVALSIPGKEVEELSLKEIDICLRNKIPASFFITKYEIVKKEKSKDIPKYIYELYIENVKDKCKVLILDESGNILYSEEIDKFIKEPPKIEDAYYALIDSNYTTQIDKIVKSLNIKKVICPKKICKSTDIEVSEI